MPATEPSSRSIEQSLAVLDTQTGALADFPDARTAVRAKQTLYSGLAFSRDGNHIYASMASLTDPEGRRQRRCRQRHCGLQLCRGKDRAGATDSSAHGAARRGTKDPAASRDRTAIKGVPYPAAIAVVGEAGNEKAAGRRQSFRRCRCCSIQRRAPSKSDSISPRATPCLRPIRSHSRQRRTASAHSSRSGTRRRSLSSNLVARHGRAQAGAAQAVESRRSGNTSLRSCFLARSENALCRARQPRCGCGRECGRGAICSEGLL